ncbi:hypothetical protein RP20_CCG010123 [Aedes albopictus]|nr:hypothetical protein RP20_CCG010123 [Aedes albopictus]
MCYTTSYRSCSALLLMALLAYWVQVHGYHRASHDKCEEYRSLASSNLGNCVETQRAQRYPHLAFFGWKKQDNPQAVEFLSIGNLISDRYLLAAALSTRYHQKPPDVVRFEVVDLGVEYQLDANDYEVAEVIAHPNYTRSLAYNDIALVKLREPLSFSVGIRPACLWGSLQMNFTSLVTMAFSSTADEPIDRPCQMLIPPSQHRVIIARRILVLRPGPEKTEKNRTARSPPTQRNAQLFRRQPFALSLRLERTLSLSTNLALSAATLLIRSTPNGLKLAHYVPLCHTGRNRLLLGNNNSIF